MVRSFIRSALRLGVARSGGLVASLFRRINPLLRGISGVLCGISCVLCGISGVSSLRQFEETVSMARTRWARGSITALGRAIFATANSAVP